MLSHELYCLLMFWIAAHFVNIFEGCCITEAQNFNNISIFQVKLLNWFSVLFLKINFCSLLFFVLSFLLIFGHKYEMFEFYSNKYLGDWSQVVVALLLLVQIVGTNLSDVAGINWVEYLRQFGSSWLLAAFFSTSIPLYLLRVVCLDPLPWSLFCI